MEFLHTGVGRKSMNLAEQSPPRLALRGINKFYPGIIANQNVHLTVMPGEIHAVLGENGAGKSTLMKIIYGVVKPDEGDIIWNGQPLSIQNPAQARKLGIGMVFQHFSLFETLSVAENIALALPGKQDKRALAKRIADVSAHYGLPLQADRLVHSLSVGERQRVEIVRCLLQQPRLLIMDEPTSVLTPQAVRKLFTTLRQLADEGCSILYVSHKLDEIRELCHKATVLRGGQVTGTIDPRQESNRSLAEMMIGATLPQIEQGARAVEGALMLEVQALMYKASTPFGIDLYDIHLSVAAGEILGIAGISGNGQQELLQVLSGEQTLAQSEAIRLQGQAVGHLNAEGRRQLGLRFVPEDRLGRGAVSVMSLSLNALLTGYDAGLSQRHFIRYSKMRDFSRACIERFKVKCTGSEAEARSLSGGNVQKYIVGRELMFKPQVLIVAQPTWGVDVGAASFIRQALLDLRAEGVAILVISEDLDELFEICDRIAVMNQGHLSASQPVWETSREAIGLLMGAGQQQEAVA